jgi:2-octaprenyl-6-methoxyphenol hydroxylase
MAKQYTARRLVLVGDAAHGMHPIAGQGLNLGLRDAATLAQVVVETARLGLDIGGGPMLDQYRRWRRVDILLMMGVTDSLNKLFTSGLAPVKLARDLGLWAVEHTPPLKSLFMRHAMGVAGDLPRPLKGEAI